MAPKKRKLDRRQFLVLAGGVVATGAMGGLYIVSDCPISADGICTGPCAACYDANGNALCDRIESSSATTAAAAAVATATVDSSFVSTCPFGLQYDAYPGQCLNYVDTTGSGYCDYSEPAADSMATATPDATTESSATAEATAEATATAAVVVACPFGILNDPFPGQCNRYCDLNNNAICDLSEPEESSDTLIEETATTAVATATATAAPAVASDSTVDTSVTGQVACPKGQVWDPYPGLCHDYVDSNGNGYCDYSEPALYEQLSSSSSGSGRGSH